MLQSNGVDKTQVSPHLSVRRWNSHIGSPRRSENGSSYSSPSPISARLYINELSDMDCQIKANEDIFQTKSTTSTNNKSTSNCVTRIFNRRRRDSSPAKNKKSNKDSKSDSLSNYWNGTPTQDQRQHMIWSASNGRTEKINNNYSENPQSGSRQVLT